MARSRPVLLTAALSAAAVLGYLTYRDITGDADSPAGDEAAVPLPVATLPDFSLANLAGEQQSIRSWPGKPLLINFWATWCGPCLREIPMLKELQAARPDLQVVGIAIDKPELVSKFAGDIQFNYAILMGQNEAWAAAGALGVNIFALPFTVFTAGDGSILGVHTGELHAEHLEAYRDTVDALTAGRIDVDEARRRIDEAI
ncbi:MAG TPA: TlpA disulfide reductase family protein [Gammaproteobacteria bacterium]|nr:TlpA disulfide reductase family protein [Gammaproteobacteria bacterium]